MTFIADAYPNKGRIDWDERFTRLKDFLPWHQEFRHTLDAAGCPEAPVSRLIGRWCGRGGISANGLEWSWDGEVIWCNGPYSAPSAPQSSR